MNMKKLLLEMYHLSEADGPDYNNPFAPSSPTMSQTAYDTPEVPEKPESDGHVNPNQATIDKNNLLQKLFTLLTQLTQAKTPKSESCVSSIAKVLYEEIELVEAELSNTGTIEKLKAEIDDVVAQLQPYANEPDVKSAFQRVQTIKNATYNVAPKYTGSFTPDKLKRFNDLLAKAGKPQSAQVTAPAAAEPQTQTTTDTTQPSAASQSVNYTTGQTNPNIPTTVTSDTANNTTNGKVDAEFDAKLDKVLKMLQGEK